MLPKGLTLKECRSFSLTDPIPLHAAQRLMREVTSVEPAPALSR